MHKNLLYIYKSTNNNRAPYSSKSSQYLHAQIKNKYCTATFLCSKMKRNAKTSCTILRYFAALIGKTALRGKILGYLVKLLRQMNKRRIKKYANRRLYDTEDSRYVTLEDIRKLIVKGIDIEVIDDVKNQDITRTLMLQIMSEQEFSGKPILSEELLAQLIRFYGHPLQGYMSSYLSASVDLFVKQQRTMQKQFNQFVSAGPLDAMQDFTSKNMELWADFQKSFFNFDAGNSTEDKE